jgi:hypothetical protein
MKLCGCRVSFRTVRPETNVNKYRRHVTPISWRLAQRGMVLPLIYINACYRQILGYYSGSTLDSITCGHLDVYFHDPVICTFAYRSR